jgi:hypothetical protein
MLYRQLADVVMLVHFGFILFVAIGGILAWRWRKLIALHLASVVWGIGIILIGYECPLTPLERYFRRRGGEEGYEEGWGFVDAYIEGVIYPEEYTSLLRALAAALIAIGWFGYLLRRRSRQDPGRRDAHQHAGTMRSP